MKKLITIMLAVFCMALFFGQANAVSNVEANGGYYYFATKGDHPETGFSFKLTIPTGLDSKNIVSITERIKELNADSAIIVSDTVYDYTFQWMLEGETVFSNFEVNDEIKEVESKIFSTYARKTLGFWTMFGDIGLTYWDVPNSLGDNKSFEGYYVALGAKPFMNFRGKIGTYILKQGADEPRLFVFGLNLGYKF